MSELPRWPGDTVEEFDPASFAVAFVRAMRKQPSLRWVPSLRTALAIPQLLAARWLRTRSLIARDYAEVAALCTPLEDRRLAVAVAESLLFKETDAAKKVARILPDEIDTDAQEKVAPDDPLAGIAMDLASLDLDFSSVGDLSDLGSLLEATPASASAFDLFERLYSSADPAERGLGELICAFGGPAMLEASGLRELTLAQIWTIRQLVARAGDLEPGWIAHGVSAGFGPELLRACSSPHELAGVLAASGHPDLEAHLDDILDHGSCRDLGRTLLFLGPHPAAKARRESFAEAAVARASDLTDLAELMAGLGRLLDPSEALMKSSVAANPRRALEAAAFIEQSFSIDLRPKLFELFLRLEPKPSLSVLSVVAVDCPKWAAAVKAAVPVEAARFDDHPEGAPLDARWFEVVRLAAALHDLGLTAGKKAAAKLATEIISRAPSRATFLPLLDAFVSRSVLPDSLQRVLDRARALGVPEGEVYDRLGAAIEQLQEMVRLDVRDAERYRTLIARIPALTPQMMEKLCRAAAKSGNLEAMAALLAIDMGSACEHLPPALAADAVGYKGIGGGRNLLVQWYQHRLRLDPAVRSRIKAQVKAALLDEAFDWMGKGGGSGERGVIPQSQARPFRAGDELDSLDIEETLDAIVSSGKTPDQITEDDLFAHERVRGKAAICVLIDISGSMGGGELAACAVAVVMLLGRLLPEEVALAAFESDTHVIKELFEEADLDAVADQVLELESTGGTRVDAALRWSANQLSGAAEADLRVLFLLSDFAFFEADKELHSRASVLSEQGAKLLAASHGYVQEHTLSLLLDTIGGERLPLGDLSRLPALMLEAIAALAP